MYGLIKPLLFKQDPEVVHEFVKRNAKWIFPLVKQTPKWIPVNHQVRTTLVNQTEERKFPPFIFSNPVGLAAGFDKNGEMVHLMHHLGFGFMEVGSVTGAAYKGNPRPRIFRLPGDYAIVNRMGLPGKGAFEVSTNLAYNLPQAKIPVGVNIASTPGVEHPIDDILYAFKQIRHLQIAYVTVNISCPNTETDTKLPIQFVKDLFYELMVANKDYKIPIFLKLSPDHLEFAQEVVLATKECSGYVCGNTSNKFPTLNAEAGSQGGVSGEPLRIIANMLGQTVHDAKIQDQMIIACGGVSDGLDAFRNLHEFADLVQLYTALIYQGPGLVTNICQHLSEQLPVVPNRSSDKILGGI